MKRFLWVFCALLLLCLTPGARADWEPDTDYMALMQDAAVTGDREAGLAAETARGEKLAALGLDYPTVRWDELYLLAKMIYAEAGAEQLSEEWKLSVGEVVLNRVASKEFPDTLWQVCMQPGQYEWASRGGYDRVRPDLTCVVLARRLLEGERVLADPSVVFMGENPYGGGIHSYLTDEKEGTLYFCYSFNPQFYLHSRDET